jgi:pyroglutamyl-peptidase
VQRRPLPRARRLRGAAPPPLAGFVHLPYLPRQVAALAATTRDEHRLGLGQRADLASMGPELMREGARLAIETSLAELGR